MESKSMVPPIHTIRFIIPENKPHITNLQNIQGLIIHKKTQSIDNNSTSCKAIPAKPLSLSRGKSLFEPKPNENKMIGLKRYSLIAKRLSRLPDEMITTRNQLQHQTSRLSDRYYNDKVEFESTRSIIPNDKTGIPSLCFDSLNKKEILNEFNTTKQTLSRSSSSFFITKNYTNQHLRQNQLKKILFTNHYELPKSLNVTPKANSSYNIKNIRIKHPDRNNRDKSSSELLAFSASNTDRIRSRLFIRDKDEINSFNSRDISLLSRVNSKQLSIDKTRIYQKGISPSVSICHDKLSPFEQSQILRESRLESPKGASMNHEVKIAKIESPKLGISPNHENRPEQESILKDSSQNRDTWSKSSKLVKMNHEQSEFQKSLIEKGIEDQGTLTSRPNYDEEPITYMKIKIPEKHTKFYTAYPMSMSISSSSLSSPYSAKKRLSKQNSGILRTSLTQSGFRERMNSYQIRSKLKLTKSGKYPNINQVKNDRLIFILTGDFIEFGLNRFEVVHLKIPCYEVINDHFALEKDFKDFLINCKEQTESKKIISHVKLINGVPIQNLAEIPIECNILIGEKAMDIDFRQKYNNFHKLALSDKQWDLLIYMLNKQKTEKGIRYILFNDQIASNILQNSKFPLEKIFDKQLIKWDKLTIPTHTLNTASVMRDNMDSIVIQHIRDYDRKLNGLEKESTPDESEKNQGKENEHWQGNEQSPVQENGLERVQENSLEQGNVQRLWVENHHQQQLQQAQQLRVSELPGEEHNNGHPHILNSRIEKIDLDNLNEYDSYEWMNQIEKFLLESGVKRNVSDLEECYNPNGLPYKQKVKNHIKENIYQTTRDEILVFDDIFNAMPSLQELNIPKLMLETGLKREELYHYFSQYKALCQLSSMNKKRAQRKAKPSAGFDKKMIKLNLAQFMTSHDEIINRLSSSPTKLFNDENMKWNQYLHLMSSMNGKTISGQLNIFAKLIDVDSNGALSWNEVKNLVVLCLDKFKSKDSDEVIDYLSDYFAKFLFESLGVPKTQEIPIAMLTNLILEGSEAAQMLLQMCGGFSSNSDGNNKVISMNRVILDNLDHKHFQKTHNGNQQKGKNEKEHLSKSRSLN